jgi:hypothetical protein
VAPIKSMRGKNNIQVSQQQYSLHVALGDLNTYECFCSSSYFSRLIAYEEAMQLLNRDNKFWSSIPNLNCAKLSLTNIL